LAAAAAECCGSAKGANRRLDAIGVESTEDLAFLRAVECPVGQGFLFSRPLPATEITQLLAEGGSLGPPAASAEFRAS